jgi:RNA polymerase sigma-70 factor (ECF subfamily)
MRDYTDLATSLSLLDRLSRLADQEQAWREFIQRYGGLILGWCRTRGLQPADAEDVSQELLVKLFVEIRKGRYDPARGKFRAWLKTLAMHTLSDVLTDMNRAGRGSGDSQVGKILEQIEDASDDLAQLLDLEEKREQARLLQLAEERVRAKRIRGENTWEVWCMLKEGKSTEEVAQHHNMSKQNVLVAKARMIGYLKQEIEELGKEKFHPTR